MSNIDRCDSDIFQHGKTICHFHAPAKPTEEWVRLVAAESGQRVDWSYCGGYAGVKFIGDEARVRRAIEKLRPLLCCDAFRLYESDP